jgi:hypothetical protein
MVLLTGLALVFVVILLCGGRPARLAELRLTATWLLLAALGLQLVAFPVGGIPWAPSDDLAIALSYASYGCLIAFTLANRRMAGALVAGVGMTLNLIAISLNGGHMPATPQALRAAGKWENGVHLNSVNLAHPTAPWLVDRFATPSWVPLASVFSVGDILIVAGAGMILWRGCGAHLPRRRAQQSGDTGLAGGPSGTR